jgi:hypothetical protein
MQTDYKRYSAWLCELIVIIIVVVSFTKGRERALINVP